MTTGPTWPPTLYTQFEAAFINMIIHEHTGRNYRGLWHKNITAELPNNLKNRVPGNMSTGAFIN